VLQVVAFTGGITVPSARFRVRQHIPSLQQYGIVLTEMSSHFGVYPPQNKWARPFWAGAALAEQIPKVIKSHSYDAVLLQREMLSSLVTLEPLTKKPRVLDVDDAIFLCRNGMFARRLAQVSDRVICGNSYLADRFSAWNKDVTVIPTAVDTERYTPSIKKKECKNETVIGWIGTSGNMKFVNAIEPALAKVMQLYPKTKLRFICDKAPKFDLIDLNRCDFIQWSESREVECIQSMDIGIMPLEDSDWSRGKCSFKMLQYMACGIPVVVSPVGMNTELLSMGSIGIGAVSNNAWEDALITLLSNLDLSQKMGIAGRQVVVDSFSVAKITPQIANVLSCV